MGKPGGFFKKLRAKERRDASKRRRGTKGASKEDRRAKHNERVEYYAAKREAEDLAAISSSSDEAPSTDSETETRKEEQSLMRLRRVLGVTTQSKKSESNGNGHGAAPAQRKTGRRESSGGAGEEAQGSEDDWQAYLSDSDDSNEEDNEAEYDENAEGGMGDDDDDDIEEEEEDVEGSLRDVQEYEEEEEEGEEEEEKEENEESDREDAFDAADDGDSDAEGDSAALLLPHFHHGTTSAAALQHIIEPGDPWLARYHEDRYGPVDQSPLQSVPRATVNGLSVSASAQASKLFLHDPFAPPRDIAKKRSRDANGSDAGAASARPMFMHEALWRKWTAYCAATGRGPLTADERGMLDLLQGYPDVVDCTRSWDNADARREVFLLHMLNHWFKARAVVLAHDRILATRRRRERQQRKSQTHAKGHAKEHEKKGSKKKNDKHADSDDDDDNKNNSDDNDNEEEELGEDYQLRDRGFGRTRLLLMLPLRNIAHRYMTTLVQLLGATPANCPKLSTFDTDFTELPEAEDPTFKRRPRDYQRQFEGNIDDAFCVGVRLHPNRVSVYAHPLNSDLILCSPLGLRRRLERSGDALVSLASIELCVVDEAHVLLMQNWQHAAEVLAMLNKRPKDTTRGLSDLRRVYAWALEGHSGRHRQTVLSSNVSHATLLASARTFVSNSGRVLLQHREEAGALAQVMVPVRQHFVRFDPGDSPAAGDDARFDVFTREVYAAKIHPLVERDVRTIIFVPSYFDYVRLRNYMIREYRENFAAICEYSSLAQQRKALGQFTDLERPLLLVTERFYFFKRYFVKLAEVIVFYSPPVFPSFYVSLVNRLVATSPNAFALTLFCRFDTHELNRLVGTKRARQLLEREADAFSFVTQ